MQHPETAATILTTCVHQEVPDIELNPNIVKEQMIPSSNELTSASAAFPMVQPMKAYVPYICIKYLNTDDYQRTLL